MTKPDFSKALRVQNVVNLDVPLQPLSAREREMVQTVHFDAGDLEASLEATLNDAALEYLLDGKPKRPVDPSQPFMIDRYGRDELGRLVLHAVQNENRIQVTLPMQVDQRDVDAANEDLEQRLRALDESEAE